MINHPKLGLYTARHPRLGPVSFKIRIEAVFAFCSFNFKDPMHET